MAKMISPVRQRQLVEFWPSRQPLSVLAEEWECSTSNISQIARRLGLPSRSEAFSKKCVVGNRYPLSEYIQSEADRRGIDVDVLYYRVLRAVIRDKLVGAILDDGEDLREAA